MAGRFDPIARSQGQLEECDLIIKAKFGDTLKRFSIYSHPLDIHQNLQLTGVQSKIASAFKISADAELILTYTDEDGDDVLLDDDEDLLDAIIHQKLNPLRINVQLKERSSSDRDPPLAAKSDPSGSVPKNAPFSGTSSDNSQFQVKAVVEEALKAIPEPFQSTFLKLYQDLLAAATPAPSIKELIDQFVKLGTSNNSQTANVPMTECNHGAGSSAKQCGKMADQGGSGDCNGKPSMFGAAHCGPVPRPFAPESSRGFASQRLARTGCPYRPPFSKFAERPAQHMPGGFPEGPCYPPNLNIPYPGRLLGRNLGCTAQPFHTGVICDGCGAQPIVGARYKSIVKDNYDLCSACFSKIVNEADYTKIDWPIGHQRICGESRRFNHPAYRGGWARPKREKLESRFILDVTIPDGTLMATSTPFTKIWRMRNNGSTMWPYGTQLVWVGGDQFAILSAVHLEIPQNGFPVDEEIDIAVDFVAPKSPGRYISYWRLVSPTGHKFGQRVWVLIQVEQPDGTNSQAGMNLSLNLPGTIHAEMNENQLIDINVSSVDAARSDTSFDERAEEAVKDLLSEVDAPKQTRGVSVYPSAVGGSLQGFAPAAGSAPVLQIPVVDFPRPSNVVPVTINGKPAMVTEPATIHAMAPPMPAHLIDLGPSSSTAAPPAAPPAPVPESTPMEEDNQLEGTLLKELDAMGFKQVDLNKEILRQNNYNFEQSVEDLCSFIDWDPLLNELRDMGFNDANRNVDALKRNGGSIKWAVMDLVSNEKKQQ